MFWRQERAAVRVEWGEAGLLQLAPLTGAVVTVDVLSFSTCVDVGMSGGVAVLPCRWRDVQAATFEREGDARLVDARGEGGPSLSPGSLRGLPAGTRLVLPSPNGGALCALAEEVSGADVFAACLRNAEAVGTFLRGRYDSVLVVAASAGRTGRCARRWRTCWGRARWW